MVVDAAGATGVGAADVILTLIPCSFVYVIVKKNIKKIVFHLFVYQR